MPTKELSRKYRAHLSVRMVENYTVVSMLMVKAVRTVQVSTLTISCDIN